MRRKISAVELRSLVRGRPPNSSFTFHDVSLSPNRSSMGWLGYFSLELTDQLENIFQLAVVEWDDLIDFL